jgi:tetratricopeptide (TPR) repeat protein
VADASIALPALVGDPELRLEHLILRARVAKQLVRSEEALALLEPEAERLRQRPPGLRLCQLVNSLGALYDDVGRHAEGLAHLREAHDLARALGARYLQVDIAINLLFCYADLRRYDDAERSRARRWRWATTTTWRSSAATSRPSTSRPVASARRSSTTTAAGRGRPALPAGDRAGAQRRGARGAR